MPNIKKLTENLEKNGFMVSYYETGVEAVKAIAGAVNGKTVGIGGSKTIEACSKPSRTITVSPGTGSRPPPTPTTCPPRHRCT